MQLLFPIGGTDKENSFQFAIKAVKNFFSAVFLVQIKQKINAEAIKLKFVMIGRLGQSRILALECPRQGYLLDKPFTVGAVS